MLNQEALVEVYWAKMTEPSEGTQLSVALKEKMTFKCKFSMILFTATPQVVKVKNHHIVNPKAKKFWGFYGKGISLAYMNETFKQLTDDSAHIMIWSLNFIQEVSQ